MIKKNMRFYLDIMCLFATDAENKESLSKNGITHILSVYNNAKPVFEVSKKLQSRCVQIFQDSQQTFPRNIQ